MHSTAATSGVARIFQLGGMRGARAISSGATIGADPWSVRGGLKFGQVFGMKITKLTTQKCKK